MAIEQAEKHDSTHPRKVSDLGRYRLIAELARGGMGVVFLALVRGPAGFNKLFVVKELKTHLAEDPAFVAMFMEEARLAAKLNHPNVVQTIEVGNDGARYFIAMEFLDGQPFNRAVSRARKDGAELPLAHHLYVISRMLEGLHYAHTATDFDGTPLGLVHRDVSPHNVFVTYDGQVKVLDFGIAKALGTSSDTRTGVLKGKVAYMAPEQASGSSIDARADVFAAGAMLFEAATGTRMWSKDLNDLQIIHALARGDIPAPRALAPTIDVELERIIVKATAFDREKRYATAAEMRGDIEARLTTLAAAAAEVGKYFSSMFAAERERIKQVIDDQLRTLRRLASGEFRAVDLPRLAHSSVPSGTPSGVLLARPPTSSAPPYVAPSPQLGRDDLDAPPSARGSSVGTLASVPIERIAPRRSPLPLVAGLALAVIGGALALFAYERSAPSPATGTAAAASDSRNGAQATNPAASSNAAAIAASGDATSTVDAGAPAKAASPAVAPAWRTPVRSSVNTSAPTTPPPTSDAPLVQATPAVAPSTATAATRSPHARQQIDTHDPYAP